MYEAGLLANIFLASSEAGPTMGDGNAMYSTAHGNKLGAGAGSALSQTSVGAGQQLMRNMKGLDNATPLNLVPRYILSGTALEQTAQQICAAISPVQLADVNPFAGLLVPLIEPRFTSTTSWRLFADPAQLPVIEIAYLNGFEGPVVEQKPGWDVDGMEFKCRFELGCGAVEWRGTVYSPGA
jgi:hypothetical protein